jgi:hypothetical protein
MSGKWRLVALGIVFAVPAAIVTNESFQPVDDRVQLGGRAAEHRFVVPDGAPVFLEYGVILRAAEGPRPTIAIALNGTPAVTLAGDRLFITQSAKILLPVHAVQAGSNVLTVTLDGPPDATFDLHGRIQNYFGIAPDFPRVFVVSDESVTHANRGRSVLHHVVRWVVFWVVGVMLAVVLGMASKGTSRTGGREALFLAAPSVLPWFVLGYGLATQRHVWLSTEALAVTAGIGAAVAGLIRWVAPRRALVLNVTLFAVLTFAMVEGALRAYHYVRPSFIFYSDPAGRYRGQPGAPHYGTRLNSGGFNDVEHTRTRPPHVRHRIVALGDSFALGSVPYASNYLTRLESELAADGSVEVINMGVSGTDPIDYLSMLVQEGLAFQPDLVLVNVFVGNDFEARRRAWYEYSYVATLVHAVWQIAQAGIPATAPSDGPVATYRDDEPSVTLEKFLEIEVDRSWIYVAGSDELSAATTRVGAYLRAIRDAASRAGARTLIVVIPDEVQVNDALREEVIRASGHTPGTMDMDQPNRALAAELAHDGIPMLDLLPVFRAGTETGRLYKPQDTHWNIAGNELAARQIAAFVRRSLQ